MTEKQTENLPVKAEAVEAENALPMVAPEPVADPLVMAARIERALEGKARILRAILSPKLAGKEAFIDMQGKPWLPGAAAQRIAGPCGICVKPDRNDFGDINFQRVDGNDEEGAYFDVTVAGVAYQVNKPEQVVTDIGKGSSRDNTHRRAGKRLPVEAVSPGDVYKHALTNLWARLVQALLGLRGLTWEELEDIGHRQAEAPRVDFKEGGKKPPASPRPPQEEKAAPAKRGDIKKKIGHVLMEMAGGDKEVAAGFLFDFTKFTTSDGKDVPGVESLKDRNFSDKWAFRSWKEKIEPAYEEWQKKQAAKAPEPPPDGELAFQGEPPETPGEEVAF